jgi:hypothetical protein
MGADRTEAIASVDGGGPSVLGRFSARFGTPAGMNVLSGVVATVLMIRAFKITNANKYFEAVLGLTISTTTISYPVHLLGADQAPVLALGGRAPYRARLGDQQLPRMGGSVSGEPNCRRCWREWQA